MAFPTGQANGATTVINGITYSYNSTDLSWSPTAATANASVVLTSGATFTGAVTFNATPTFAAGNVSISGTVTPGTTNVYDLGSSSLRWRNIYTQDLHLSNGIGDYTVIEGEEDLFLVNNKSGKSFKFALIEVDPSIVPPKSNC
jgi:hypothetical protein